MWQLAWLQASAKQATPCPSQSIIHSDKEDGRRNHSAGAVAGIYKGTVNLPDTKFNMRANSVQREPQLQVPRLPDPLSSSCVVLVQY